MYGTQVNKSVATTMHSIAEQLSSMGEYQKAHDQFVSLLGSLSGRE